MSSHRKYHLAHLKTGISFYYPEFVILAAYCRGGSGRGCWPKTARAKRQMVNTTASTAMSKPLSKYNWKTLASASRHALSAMSHWPRVGGIASVYTSLAV